MMIQRAIEYDDCAEQTRSIPIWLYKEIRIRFRNLTQDLIENYILKIWWSLEIASY